LLLQGDQIMKFKSLFQALVLLTLVFSTLGASQNVRAKTNFSNLSDVQIVLRDVTYWNAIYTGTVSATVYEKWSFDFAETNKFTVTATPTSGDLVPLISLLDANGNVLSSLAGSLTSTQPAGSYSVLIQPQSGSGSYSLAIRKTAITDGTAAAVTVDPSSINVNETSVVTVSLSNVPLEGLTSAEFTCTYDPALIEVSNIAESGLFGTDAVLAVNGPTSGAFIVAIAGSNGKKATTSGGVFTFSAKGLQLGEATITCVARVSIGDKTLTEIPSTPAILTIAATVEEGTFAGKVLAGKPVTVSLYDADNAVVKTATANTDGTFSLTAPVGTYIAVATAEGFLKAQGAPVITSGATTTFADISLPAGDIDGNDVIDQFDAMTIGMSYNTATPAAADLNNDGTINVLDLELLASNYRKSGALAWQ
jgi:hypothetical protein